MKKPYQHLEFFIANISKSLSALHNTEVFYFEKFCLGILERLRNVSVSLKVAIENLQTHPELEFSCGIAIRALILDMLIALNIQKLISDLEKKETTEENIKLLVLDYCNERLSDGLSFTLSYAELLHKVHFIDDEELKKAFNNFSKTYIDFILPYSADGSKPKLKYSKIEKTSQLFESMFKDEEMKEISKIYDVYQYYSKYDHFGILYFTVLDAPMEKKIEKLAKTIELLVSHHANLYMLLLRFSESKKLIEEQAISAGSYLLQNKSGG